MTAASSRHPPPGAIEVAADTLVNVSAPAGKARLWLIDPQNIIIDADNVGAIVTALEGRSDVTVTTADGTPPYGTGSSGPGNIIVAASIQPDLGQSEYPSLTQNVTFTVMADNDVTIDNDITIGPASADAGDSMGVTITAGKT